MKKYILSIGICFLLLGANFNAKAQITNSGFETGSLNGWNASSGVTASSGFSLQSWSVSASGGFMARIEPNSSIMIGSAESNLGLSSGALVSFNSGVFGGNGTGFEATNFATLTQDISLLAGQTVTMYWNYVSQDYSPFNDGVIATMSGPAYQQIRLLAVTDNAYGNPQTVVTGSFGSTSWSAVTFTAGAAGTYRLGFAAFNSGDQAVNPILFIDNAPGGTSAPGQAVVTTSAVTPTSCSAVATGGNVSSDGGSAVTARGVCWNTSTLPTIANNFTNNGTGTGSFTSNISGLSPGLTYYIRAYATNIAGTVYGPEITYTTDNTDASITASGPLSFCSGNSVNLTASSGTSYLWNNGQTTQTINVTQTGSYFVTITNNCGAQSVSNPVNVTVNPLPVITSCPTNISLNTTSSCTATATYSVGVAGSPTLSYSFSGATVGSGSGTGSNSLFNVGQTTVIVTATNSCGSQTCSFTVEVIDNQPPTISCPFDVVINAPAGQCGAVVNYPAPSATDNCGTGNLPTSIPGYTYKGTFESHTYFLSNAMATPEDAHANAVALGGHLATISNAAENAFISAMSPNFMWIGFTDRDVEGTWKWITNEPVTYTNWAPGEPNNAGNEDWAVINWGGSPKWNDWLYTVNAYYVVEFDGGTVPTSLVSGLGSGATFPVGTTTETWQAVDNSGNVSTCSFTVTVINNQNPTITAPANISVNADYGSCYASNVNLGSPVANNNCSGTSISNNAPASFPIGNTTVNWTITDASNNSATATQTVTVTDTQLPSISCPFNITVNSGPNNCGAVVNYTAPAATDNCGTGNLPTSIPGYTYKGTYEGHTYFLSNTMALPEDAHANAVALGGHLATISNAAENAFISAMSPNFMWIGFTDRDVEGTWKWITNEPVTYTNWAPGEPNNSGNEDWAVINWGGSSKWNDWHFAATAYYVVEFDGGTVPTTLVSGLGIGATFPVGTTTETWQAVDASGNVSTCSFTVTVNDATAPTAIAQNTTVQLDANGNATVTAAQIDNGSSDACGIATMNVSPASFNCSNIGANSVTLTVTDNNGNVSTANATVTIEDNVAPNAIAQNITVQLDANGNASITAAQIDNGSSDNCGNITLSVSPNTFDCNNVTTNSPNSFSLNFDGNDYVNIPDAPELRITGDITVEAWFKIDVMSTDWVRIVGKGNPTLRNYGLWYHPNGTFLFQQYGGGVELSVVQALTTGQWYHIAGVRQGNTSRLYINGNLVHTAPANGTPHTSADPLTIGYSPGLHTYHKGQIDEVRIWNVARTNAEIAANFNTVLTSNEAGLVAYYEMEEGSGTIIGNKTNSNHTGTLIGFTQPVVWTGSNPNLAGNTVNGNTVVLTVTDNYGNVSSATATVTVQDNIAPTVLTNNVAVQLDANGEASITVAQIDNASFDNCGIATLILDNMNFNCSNVGNNTVTLTATDVNGNVSSATATVTVEDNIAPTVLTNNVTVQLDANGEASISVAQIDNASYDNCSIATLTLDNMNFNCSNVGNNTVTLTATDVSGNVASATATVTIEDNTAPTVLTNNVTIQLDASGNASITVAQIDNGSSDNCGIASLTLDNMNFTCSNVGNNIVTLTATDVNGNVASATATVTVEDNIAPSVLTNNVTVQLDANGNASITVAQIDNASFDNCGIATLTLDNMNFNCSNVGINTVTLTATDVNGNVASATATVTVEDNIAPSITVPADVTMNGYCMSIPVSIGNAATTDNCGVANVINDAPALFPVGSTTVTWTVTDVNGNSTSATQEVDVVPGIVVANAGNDVNTYYGYAPMQCATLNGSASGGTGIYTYSWNTGSTTTSTTECPTVPTTYTFTVTDNHECVGTDVVTVNALDVRCGNKNDKVEYCHKGKNSICISPNAVPAHIAQGGYFGPCSTSGEAEDIENAFNPSASNVFNVYPNPTYNAATVEFSIGNNQVVLIELYDSKGAFVKQVFKGLAIEGQNNKVQVDAQETSTGVYFIRMSTDTEVKHVKLVRTN